MKLKDRSVVYVTGSGKGVEFDKLSISVNNVLRRVFPLAGSGSVCKLADMIWVCRVDNFSPTSRKPIAIWERDEKLEVQQPYSSWKNEHAELSSWIG